jgi:hypothetical protein
MIRCLENLAIAIAQITTTTNDLGISKTLPGVGNP